MKNITKIDYMQDLYKLLEKKKLTSIERIFIFCEETKPDEIVETCVEAFTITLNRKKQKTLGSLFNFSASLTLSGDSYPCSSETCRLKQVDYLAKFTSIYSDCTTIHNPFDFVYPFINPEEENEMSEDNFRNEAINAFLITLEFKPLIERGLIRFSNTVKGVCIDCKQKLDDKRNLLFKKLDNIALSEVLPLLKEELKIEYEKGSFHLVGTESLINEDMFIHYQKKLPNFMIQNGEKIKDLKDIKSNHPLIKMLVGQAINSIMLQKIGHFEQLTQTYLTNNLLEKTILENMNKKAEIKPLNFIVNGIPILQGIPYESILEMRENYSDEFKSFRLHISDLFQKASAFETQNEFNFYINKELKEQLVDLKKINKETNKKIITKGIAGGAFLGASIAISSLTNSLPYLISVAKTTYDCVNTVREAGDLGDKLQKSPLYFYYKLEKLNN